MDIVPNTGMVEEVKTLATAGTVPGRDRTEKEFDVRKHTDRAGVPTTYADTNFRSRLTIPRHCTCLLATLDEVAADYQEVDR